MEITCSRCGKSHSVQTYNIINTATNPDLKESLKRGELSLFECPACGQRLPLRYETLYHDPGQKLMIWLCTDEKSAARADMLVRSIDGLEDYRLRLVDSFGEMIEKINISDCGLDDIAVELCKYVAKLDIQETQKQNEHLESILQAPFKFLRTDGADNALTFAYPLDGRMEMVEIPFSMYENASAILSRNPALKQGASGFARVDREWLDRFLA